MVRVKADNAQCVTDGQTGRLGPIGDAPARTRMGVAALNFARSLAHDQTHARRAAIVAERFARKAAQPASIS